MLRLELSRDSIARVSRGVAMATAYGIFELASGIQAPMVVVDGGTMPVAGRGTYASDGVDALRQ